MRRTKLWFGWVLVAAWGVAQLSCAATSMGRAPDAGTLVGSDNFDRGDGKFLNPVDTASGFKDLRSVRGTLGRYMRNDQTPPGDVPVAAVAPEIYDTPPEDNVRVTWIGHSTMLVEIDGFRILTDPIWSERCSPFQNVGPRRFHRPGIELDDLPPIDAVIISHDHYDHLDFDTVKQLAWRGATFYVPLGVGAHLDEWGVRKYHELDWWQEAVVTREGRELRLVATPARHFSGRGVFDRNRTLWASWAIVGDTHRAFFGGDTGYFDGFATIGAKLGPFDVTMMPIGAYDTSWSQIHMNPEEAVRAHADMGNNGLLLPIHFGTFNLAAHGWSEPMERFHEASRASRAHAYYPVPGEPILASGPKEPRTWWRSLE